MHFILIFKTLLLKISHGKEVQVFLINLEEKSSK